jgi:hypothetical protein
VNDLFSTMNNPQLPVNEQDHAVNEQARLNLNLVGTEELVDELIRRCPHLCLAAAVPVSATDSRLVFRWTNNSYLVGGMVRGLARQIERHLDQGIQQGIEAIPTPSLAWSADVRPFRPPSAESAGNQPA